MCVYRDSYVQHWGWGGGLETYHLEVLSSLQNISLAISKDKE